MGSAVRIAPEPDLRQDYNRLGARDLDRRLCESTPTIDRVVSRASLEMVPRETQSWCSTAPIFRGLTSVECERIVSSATGREYGSRQRIVQEGDEGGEVLVMASGRAKISQISHTGDEVILRVKRAGDVLGGLGMSPSETHSSSIRTLEPCRVLSWRAEDFNRLCNQSPALQRNALQIMHDALQTLQNCFCEMATLKVSSRLARTLLRLAEQDSNVGQNVRITFTYEELGQMAGTTLFSVSRLLSKWTEMGMLYTENRCIVIEDIDRLLAIADEGPGPARQISIR
jgi:CRP-like cAMP-binding protein